MIVKHKKGEKAPPTRFTRGLGLRMRWKRDGWHDSETGYVTLPPDLKETDLSKPVQN